MCNFLLIDMKCKIEYKHLLYSKFVGDSVRAHTIVQLLVMYGCRFSVYQLKLKL